MKIFFLRIIKQTNYLLNLMDGSFKLQILCVNSVPQIKNRIVAYDVYRDFIKIRIFFFDIIKWLIG